MRGEEGSGPVLRGRRGEADERHRVGPGDPGRFRWPACEPIWTCGERRRACVCGTVSWLARVPAPGIVLCVVLEDVTGRLRLVFFGRRELPGVVEGAHVQAEGMVGRFRGARAMLNPRVRLVGPR